MGQCLSQVMVRLDDINRLFTSKRFCDFNKSMGEVNSRLMVSNSSQQSNEAVCGRPLPSPVSPPGLAQTVSPWLPATPWASLLRTKPGSLARESLSCKPKEKLKILASIQLYAEQLYLIGVASNFNFVRDSFAKRDLIALLLLSGYSISIVLVCAMK